MPSTDVRSTLKKEQSQAVRSLLDEALGAFSHADQAPRWQLSKKQNGKPYLLGTHAPAVSLSHSTRWVACAVGHTPCVGIDIETIKRRNWQAYCEYFCHKEESEWVLDASEEERDIRGLICWCRKEAFTKALGTGNTVALAEIAFTPDGQLFSLPPQFGDVTDWFSCTEILHKQAVMATVWKN